MTRLRKGPSVQELEREYVYSDPPISLTELAERHSLARSNVADKARIGEWYEKREEFRKRIDAKVTEAMAERWAEMRISVYERLMKVGMDHLDLHEKALKEGTIKANTRDMISVASMMTNLLDELAKSPVDQDPRLVNPEGEMFEGTDEEARDVIAMVKRLTAGGGDGTAPAEQGSATGDAAEGPASPRQN